MGSDCWWNLAVRLSGVARQANRTDEPENAHGGLNVTEFSNPGVWRAIRKAIQLLPSKKRRLLLLGAGIQVSLGTLDLIGVALIGLVAAVAVSGLGVAAVPSGVQALIEAAGFSDLTVSQLSVVVALAAVAILILKTGLSALMTRRLARFLANCQAETAARLAREFLSRPLTQVQRWTTPEATYALGSGVAAATVSLLGSAIIAAAEIFLFAIIGASLLIYNPLLTATAALFFGLIGFALQRLLGRLSAQNAEVMKETSIDTLGAISEALATYRESTVLNRREFYVQRFESVIGRSAVAHANTGFILEVPKYVLESALYLGILVLATVQFLTESWATAAATVALFLAAGSRIIPALLRLQGAGITIRNAAVQAEPTFFMAQYLADMQSVKTHGSSSRERVVEYAKLEYHDFSASVEVSQAWLSYDGTKTPALLGVDLEVPEGASVALVGPTGAGKSTLADLILGVLDPDKGEVKVGGRSPRDAIDTWPGAISYVPQSVALVAGSIRSNVALGLPESDIDDDLVWEALERAHLASFLLNSREGIDTTVGERGFRLSGGQRQRLGIARALYSRPKLLVLDEATSALDAETELIIIRTLEELEGSVTTITVAHRLATVRHADQVLYLSSGQVMARGAFADVRAAVDDFDRQASLLGL